jgi:hypothetical protein
VQKKKKKKKKMRKTIILVIIISLGISSCTQKDNSNKSKESVTTNSTIEKKVNVGFDTDGYYMPVDTIEYENNILVSILFATSDEKDNLGNNKIKYVELEYLDKTTDKVETTKAKEFKYKNKTISLLFETKIGKIIFNGHFLGEHGPTNDNVDDNKKIMVLNGTFTINEKYDKKTMFSYFGGE